MSYELINRITIRKNEVRISTKSNNVSGPFYAYKHDGMTKLYQEKGQAELDKFIISCSLNNWELKGNHPSIEPYNRAINWYISSDRAAEFRTQINKLEKEIDELDNALSPSEKKSLDKYYRFNDGSIKKEDLMPQLQKYIEKVNEKNKIDELVLDTISNDVNKARGQIYMESIAPKKRDLFLQLLE